MENKHVRNTILFGAFCFVYGIASILIGYYLFPNTEDQLVYIVSGIGLILFDLWYILDQLL